MQVGEIHDKACSHSEIPEQPPIGKCVQRRQDADYYGDYYGYANYVDEKEYSPHLSPTTPTDVPFVEIRMIVLEMRRQGKLPLLTSAKLSPTKLADIVPSVHFPWCKSDHANN